MKTTCGLMLKRRRQFDGRRRAHLAANGKVTIGPQEEDVWSGVLSISDGGYQGNDVNQTGPRTWRLG
eukprot:9358763-Ditylum_brightwellii.AAC.1